MKHIMVDIETLGTSSSCVILSIGAVKFDTAGGIGESFHQVIDIQSCLDAGLEVNASTIRWWMSQSDAARKVFEVDGVSLRDALDRLNTFMGDDAILWCNGANFDAPILDSAYRAVNLYPAWKYYNVRDYRTIRSMVPQDILKLLRVYPTTAHNAVADAEAQAMTLQNILNWLNGAPDAKLAA